MKVFCAQFYVSSFLMEEEWKAAAEIEAILCNTSRLTIICQNEEKLNSACGPAMRNTIHDGSSSESLEAIDVDNWRKINYWYDQR